MSKSIEIEKTYLIKEIPDLTGFFFEELKDLYIPADVPHPQMRLRKKGGQKMLTKKYPKDEKDLSVMIEETIYLSDIEYNYFENSLAGKDIHKLRYTKKEKGYQIEIDIYKGKLEGLMVADFEFDSVEDMTQFIQPLFVYKEITNNSFLAAGNLAGKSLADIQYNLDQYEK